MQLIPYLAFDGDCAEAFDFYRDAFGGEILMRMTVGESPMAADMPPETHGRLMHVHLRTGAASLMGADMQPGCGGGSGAAGGAGTCVSVMLDSVGRPSASGPRCRAGRTSACRSSPPSGPPDSAC